MKPVLNILFSLIVGVVGAQNLVKNPSFEDYNDCPQTLGALQDLAIHWSIPTEGSTDYFNSCSTVMGAPENFNGVQQPKFGNAYAGLYFYAPADYREYVQVRLTRKLVKDRKYELSFYISLAEGSDFAVKDFGTVLSYRPVAVATRKNLSRNKLYAQKGNRVHAFEINHPEFHENKTDWVKVTETFTAKGFENYLIIGNLRDNKATRTVQTRRKKLKKGAYYYIDMVQLHQAGVWGESLEEAYSVSKNIHFDFDSYQLSKRSNEALKPIYETLLAKPTYVVEIHGHTDGKGKASYNQSLSEQRARHIATFLVEQGISSDRIAIFGHGSQKPVAENNTESGRASNRRVEFVFKKGTE
ncbi:OmpA family protein [Flagellimonas sp. DF-77]|uniref:OmpA family protein n=1 Tax=Flagellimonas algarum TaxID=3230298 RepID=UPI0033972D40